MALRLPLLGKEMLEQSVRIRTYAFRATFALILVIFFFAFYLDQAGGVQARIPEQMIGAGGGFLALTFWVAFGATWLVMPALMASAIIEEEKRGSLDLLVLSGLSARSVVFQKLASRVLPLLSWQLTAMPLLAIALALGGVEREQVAIACIALILTAIQAGLISLICAAKAYTVIGAFWLSVLWNVLCGVFIFPFTGMLLGFVTMGVASATGADNAWGLGFGVTHPSVLFWLAGAPNGPELPWLLAMSLLALGPCWLLFVFAVRSLRQRVARPIVQRPPSPMDATQSQWKHMKRRKGSWIAQMFPALPDDDPVRWMERKRTFIRGRATMEGMFFLIGLPMLLIAFLALISTWQTGGEAPEENHAFTVLVCLSWAVIIPGMILVVVNAATGGLQEGTRDVLLTTPLDGKQILLQTMQGLRIQVAFFAGPVVLLVLFEMLAESTGFGKWSFYTVGWAVTGIAYVTLLCWGAMYLGLVLRQRLRALLVGILGFAAWCVLPWLIATISYGLANIRPGDDNLWGYIQLLSPAVMVYGLEDPDLLTREFGGGMWFALLANSVIYGALALALRNYCLGRADHLLGRR